MSEFKYACPVCGQHIKCDSAQSGTTMECPTCFQKIVVPQAPTSADQKFILQGTKVGGERPLPTAAADAPLPPTPEKVAFWPIVVFSVIFVAALSLLLVFRNVVFKPHNHRPPAPGQSAQTGPAGPAKAAPAAPAANDALWNLNLESAAIPDSPVAGRIHGQNFIIGRATFQNGTLTLRDGTRGPVDFGITINFSGAQAEALGAATIAITTNTDEAARVTLRWNGDTDSGRESFDSGYAMRLEFGPLENNRLPGRIYLCTPDAQKSYVLGSFNAEVRRSKPKK